MKLYQTYFLALIFVCYAYSFAWADSTSDLKNLLSSHIILLDRPLMTFNYQNEMDGFIPKNLKEAIERETGKMATFYAPEKTNGSLQGPGLYVAIDPIASREPFGSTSPQLYIVTLKAGARVLYLLQGPLFRDGFEQFARSIDCKTSTTDAPPDLAYFRNANDLNCRTKIISIIKSLNVQAIFFGYQGARTLQGCNKVRRGALSLIDGTVLDEKIFAYYSNTKKIETVDMSGYIKELYNEASDDNSIYPSRSNYDYSIPKILSQSKEVSPDLFGSWTANYIWKCGPERSGENSESEPQ